MKAALILMVLVSISAVAQTPKVDITVFTVPSRYLTNFPLGEVTKEHVIASFGVPSQQLDFQGSEMWSYDFQKQAAGMSELRETYTFVFDGDVVVDVMYRNSAGLAATAKERQQD